jgi:hypothetical protein
MLFAWFVIVTAIVAAIVVVLLMADGPQKLRDGTHP